MEHFNLPPTAQWQSTCKWSIFPSWLTFFGEIPPPKNPRRNALGGSHMAQLLKRCKKLVKRFGWFTRNSKPNFILDGFSRPNHPKLTTIPWAQHFTFSTPQWLESQPRGCHGDCRPSRTSCCYAYGRHPRCSRTPGVEISWSECPRSTTEFSGGCPPQKVYQKRKNYKQYIHSLFWWSISTTNHLHLKF